MARGLKSGNRNCNASRGGRQPELRRGYSGYCPLERRSDGSISGGGGEIERRELSSLGASVFFEEFIRKRKPLIIEARKVKGGPLSALLGLKGSNSNWAKPGIEAVAAMREGDAGSCEVEVERRHAASSPFGQQDTGTRQKTTLATFCRELEEGNELGYLNTQMLPEDSRGCPEAIAAPHVLRLLRGATRLRPKLLGKLAPVQYNLWFGQSSLGSSSGLHHDFHDNIYVLLRGSKEFRLFSPRCLDILGTAGGAKGRPKLHQNGLISYISGLRDDGAPESVIQSWKRRKATGATDQDGIDDDSEEDELDAMLDDAIENGVDDFEEDVRPSKKKKKEEPAAGGLPDSFCPVSTMTPATGSTAPAVPSALRGKHMTAKLQAGDLLYLPASWFHEVISSGCGAGGHLALNIWMAPPHTKGTEEKPYEDDFWEENYQKLRALATSEIGAAAKGKKKKVSKKRTATGQKRKTKQ
eukprot:TRINITY_DN24224_c0_g1_i1.p1 TRINITY_DN24224_c0_g1~~TRINITY_DN24224_c0_g1_i1.p1  ORF type:complete len:489 (-),score=109.92 TRINITY_DN24224_c0_g1_i1:109-1515(-)